MVIMTKSWLHRKAGNKNGRHLGYTPARDGTDLCKDFPATEDALALALSNGFFFLLLQDIPLLILPLGEHLHTPHQPTSVACAW